MGCWLLDIRYWVLDIGALVHRSIILHFDFPGNWPMARAIQLSRCRGRFAYCRMALAQEAALITVSLGVGDSVGSAQHLVRRELNDSMSEYEALTTVGSCGTLWLTQNMITRHH